VFKLDLTNTVCEKRLFQALLAINLESDNLKVALDGQKE